MNIFYGTTYLLTYLLIAYSLWTRKPMWAIVVFAAFLFCHFVIEGHKWQLVPLYLIAVLLLVVLLWQAAPQWFIISVLLITFLALFLSRGLHTIFPNFTFPEPTGDHKVGVTDVTMENGERAKIWYPAMERDDNRIYPYLASFDRPIFNLPIFIFSHLKGRDTFSFQDAVPSNRGPFPVIIYEHSADGFREENTFLLTDLVSHGYIAIAVKHRNTLADYELDLAALSTRPEDFMAAMTDVVMRDRLAELQQVVNGLPTLNQPNGYLHGKLLLDQINFLGYSLGGGIVTDYCAANPACRSVVNLDGNPFGIAHKVGLKAPYLHISQNVVLEMTKASGPSSTVAQMTELYKRDVGQIIAQTRENGFGAHWLLLHNSGHASFTDFSYWIAVRWGMLKSLFGTVETETSHQTIRLVVRKFIDQPSSFDSSQLRDHQLLSAFPEIP